MSYKDNLIDKINMYIKTNYKKINHKDMVLGDSYYNRRCHLNAVQYIKQDKAEEVYLCIYIDNGQPIVHFINKKDDKYIDNTLGWLYEQMEYYIIKQVNETEYNNIWNLLKETKESLTNLYTSSFTRFIFRIKSMNLL